MASCSRNHLESALRGIEQLWGLYLALHIYGPNELLELEDLQTTDNPMRIGGWEPGRERAVHRIHHNSSFCVQIKQTQRDACMQCDVQELREELNGRREPWLRQCHAGAHELIVPLNSGAWLLGVVFFGQFRPAAESPLPLPHFDSARQRQLLHFAPVIRAFFLEVLLGRRKRARWSARQTTIQSFLQRELELDPSLADLAAHLGLSPSRCSHVVKQETGLNFTALKQQVRLNLGRQLLLSSDWPIVAVGRHLGFRDPNYFSTWFRRQTGESPRQFRRQRRQADGV